MADLAVRLAVNVLVNFFRQSMALTIREPERLVLAIDRLHDRWFDVEGVTYDTGSRVLKIPFWSRPTGKPPLSRATGELQSFDGLLAIHDADEPKLEDREHIGTYTFNEIAYSNRQLVITAEPNLRITCGVRRLHLEFGPDAVDRVIAKLAVYPEAEVTRADDSITIDPRRNGGFKVELRVDPNRYTVYFDGGWHEHFDTSEEALKCVGFGLSSSCRLEVTYRGTLACRWAVQSTQGAEWITDSVTGRLIFPFWRRPHVVLKQNDLAAFRPEEPRQGES